MTAGERAAAEARLWLGTPYVHQASTRGTGSDCLGLIRGIWRALYRAEPCLVPAYKPDWAEADRRETLLAAARVWLVEKDGASAAVGDVLLFRVCDRGPARHLGVQSALGRVPRFIHAYSGHDVTESALSAPWARRIAARFAFPEGDN